MSKALRREGWAQTAHDLVLALPNLVSGRLQLLSLELHRAGRDIVQLMALVLATIILASAAWLAVCAGLGLAMIALGLPVPAALIVVVTVNLALIAMAVLRARRLLVDVGLPATRRHLVFGAKAASTAGSSPPGNSLTSSDLDAQIEQIEQRLIAREAWIHSTSESVVLRAQFAVLPSPWVLPAVGGGVVLWLGWHWWHRNRSARRPK